MFAVGPTFVEVVRGPTAMRWLAHCLLLLRSKLLACLLLLSDKFETVAHMSDRWHHGGTQVTYCLDV